MAADDSSNTGAKTPRNPNVAPASSAGAAGEGADPADAFKRQPPLNPDSVEPGPSKRAKKKASASAGEPREPKVTIKAEEDEPMDPADAAEEIVIMLDGLYQTAVALRGYDSFVMPDGTRITSLVHPDDKGRARVKKALTRLMKTAGTNMSPGAAFAFGCLTCWGMPIATLEFTRHQVIKAKKAGGGQ